MDLTEPISTELVTAQRHYVKIAYSQFHPNRSRNTESEGTNSFTPISNVWLSLRRFSRNSFLLDTCLSGTPIQNFTTKKKFIYWYSHRQTDEQTDIGSKLEVTYFAKKVGLIYVICKCSVRTSHRTQFIVVIKQNGGIFTPEKMQFISINIQIHDIDKMQSFMLNAPVPIVSLGCKWLSNKIQVMIFYIILLNALLPYLRFILRLLSRRCSYDLRFLI